MSVLWPVVIYLRPRPAGSQGPPRSAFVPAHSGGGHPGKGGGVGPPTQAWEEHVARETQAWGYKATSQGAAWEPLDSPQLDPQCGPGRPGLFRPSVWGAASGNPNAETFPLVSGLRGSLWLTTLGLCLLTAKAAVTHNSDGVITHAPATGASNQPTRWPEAHAQHKAPSALPGASHSCPSCHPLLSEAQAALCLQTWLRGG